MLIDEIIELTGEQTKKKYTKPLRRIAIWNDEHGYVVQLLTNNFKLSAPTIAQLYKARWMIEIFFYDKYIIMQSRYSRSDVKLLIACYFYANLA